MGENKKTDRCRKVLTLFVNKQFGDWNGLPKECTLEKIEFFFEAHSKGVGSAMLGKQYIQTSYKMFVSDEYVNPIRVWFRGDRIVKIEVDFPQISDVLKNIATKLGEPSIKLDYYMDMLLINEGEWVYSDKGISLFFNADRTALVKLSVYPPISVQNYVDQIHFSAPVREFGE